MTFESKRWSVAITTLIFVFKVVIIETADDTEQSTQQPIITTTQEVLTRERSRSNCTYSFRTSRAPSYNEAALQCSGDGYILAILKTNDLRRTFAFRQIRSLNDSQNNNFYVGARRSNEEWRWQDGSSLDDDDIAVGRGNCVVVQPSGGLLSVRCSSTHGIVCERIRNNRQSACFSSPCLNDGICVPVGCNYWCNCTNNFAGDNCSIRVLNISSQASIQVYPSDNVTLRYAVSSSLNGIIRCTLRQDRSVVKNTIPQDGRFEYSVVNVTDSDFRLSCTIVANDRTYRRRFRTTLTLIQALNSTAVRRGCAYFFTTARAASYNEAALLCTNGSNILAILNTNALRRQFAVKQIGVLNDSQNTSFYVGAMRSNGEWRWQDGSRLDDGDISGNGGDCLVVQPSGRLQSVSCSSRHGAICERIGRQSQSVCSSSSPCQNNGTCIPVGCNYRCDCRNNFGGDNCSTRILNISSQTSIQAASGDGQTLRYDVESSLPGSVQCTLSQNDSSVRNETFQQNGRFEYSFMVISDTTFQLLCMIEVDGRGHRRMFQTALTLIRELSREIDNCVYEFTTQLQRNKQAKEFCGNKNAILAVLKTPELLTFASSLIDNETLRGTYFVGAERRDDWRWIDGSVLSSAPPGSGRCAVIRPSGAIAARGCFTRHGVICEKIQSSSNRACASMPCLNQAGCDDIGCGFQCQCTDNFIGELCDTKILSVTARNATLSVLINNDAELVYDVVTSVPGEVLCTLQREGRMFRREFSFNMSMTVSETFSNVRTRATFVLTCSITSNGRQIKQSDRTVVYATKVPPTIALPASSATYPHGSDQTVRCVARGRPVPTVSWMKEGTNKPPPQSNTNNSQQAVAVLELMNVKFSDSGTYICEADGTTKMIEIKISGPPVVHQPTLYAVPIRSNKVEFNCTFEGFPLPSITWRFADNTTLPQGNSQFVVGNLEELSPYRSSRSLTMYGVNCKGTSLIGVACFASNEHADDLVKSGPFYADIPASSLTFAGPARPCAASVRVCQNSDDKLAVVPSRAIMLNINNKAERDYWVSSDTTAYYNGWPSNAVLQPNPGGCLRVARQIMDRRAVWTRNQTINAFALCERRFASQSSVEMTKNKCDGSSLNISWNIQEGAASLSHRILVNGKEFMTTAQGVDTALLTGLEPRTTYDVQVVPSFLGCTRTKLQNVQKFPTGRGNLSAPSNVRLIYSSSENICVVNWTSGSILLSEISHFNVSIRSSIHVSSRDVNPTDESYSVEVDKQRTTHTIVSLPPNTIYIVTVGAATTPNCAGRIPTAWSGIVRDCATPPKAPGIVMLSSTPPEPSSNGVTLTLSRINPRNGPISCIAVVMQKVVEGTSPTVVTDPTTLSEDSGDEGSPYIAWVSQSLDKERKLSLGSGNITCCDVTNQNLAPDCSLSTRRRKRQASSQLIRGKDQTLSNANYTYQVITSTPTEEGPLFAYSELSDPFVASVNTTVIDPPASNGIIVAIVVVVIVIIIFIIILIVLYKKKKCCFKGKTASANGHVMKPVFTVPTPDIVYDGSFDGEDDDKDDFSGRPPSPQFADFHFPANLILTKYLAKRRKKDHLFGEEFKVTLPALIKSQKIVITTARLPENTTKNRYKNILPSEHSRVLLSKIEDVPGSDYINAAYIDGYHHKNRFIAAQGPKGNTVCDFWRMVVEQRCSVIVMATLIKEGYKTKCEKYWPDVNETKTYGDVTVTGKNLVSYGEFQCTIVSLQSNADQTSWEIFHFQYLNWPDHGIPSTTSTVLRFYEAACSAQSNNAGPILIHCSAGVGRTGTLIALGILMDQLTNEGEVNVFETVYKMRLNRSDMVQNLGQYIFIHKLLAEVYKYGRTDVEASAFIAYEEQQQRIDPAYGVSGMEKEFSQLDEIPPSFQDQTSASKPVNKASHTDASVLPYDYNLAFVGMTSNDQEVPFINASNVQTYYADYFFITAQNPKPSNIHLFWRCILDNEISCVVMIQGKEKVAEYWSESGKPATFHDVTIQTIDETDCTGYLERNLEVMKDGEKKSHKILQLVVKDWPEDGVLRSTSAILQIVSILEKLTPSTIDVRGKKFLAMIHCRDGSSQAGTLCAVYNLIERVKNENKVDVFRTVKDLRDMRQKAVGHLKQYELCYSLVREYIESFDLYGNFK